MTTRNATPEECAAFGVEVCPVNWAVEYQGQVAAIFRAEPEADGWLYVHADVKRHVLHPQVVYHFARIFSDRLLELGAVGLVAEIPAGNRAAVWVAKRAGFRVEHVNEEFTLLVKEHGRKTEDSTATT